MKHAENGKVFLLPLLALLVVLAVSFCSAPQPARAEGDSLCGEDVSGFVVLEQRRYFNAAEEVIMSLTVLGTLPSYAKTVIFHSVHSKTGEVSTVARFRGKPDVVVDVKTCKEQPFADYAAEHDTLAGTIQNETVIQYGPAEARKYDI